MKFYWIIIVCVVLAVGVFVIVPAVAPTVTANGMIKTTHVTVGDTLCLLNQSEFAIPFYDNALQMNTSDIAIQKKKGEALIKSGRINDANQVYIQVLSLNGNDTVALVKYGDVLMQQGDLTGALGYYEAALRNNPEDANVWVKKGDALLLMSIEETQKLHAIAQNLSKQPDSPGYKPPVATDQMQSMDSYQNAVKSYQKAIELDPKISMIVTSRILGATQNQLDSYEGLLNDIRAPSK